MNKNHIGLSVNSVMLLSGTGLDDYKKDGSKNHVTLSRGSYFMCYWTHTFHATRISFKLGLISIALASVSIIEMILRYCGVIW